MLTAQSVPCTWPGYLKLSMTSGCRQGSPEKSEAARGGSHHCCLLPAGAGVCLPAYLQPPPPPPPPTPRTVRPRAAATRPAPAPTRGHNYALTQIRTVVKDNDRALASAPPPRAERGRRRVCRRPVTIVTYAWRGAGARRTQPSCSLVAAAPAARCRIPHHAPHAHLFFNSRPLLAWLGAVASMQLACMQVAAAASPNMCLHRRPINLTIRAGMCMAL